MIDLHCHLLPAIDDGARDLDEALAMARMAVEGGITHAVMTPHVMPGTFDNDLSTIEAAVAQHRDVLGQAGIPLEIHVGGEVRIGPEILTLHAEGRIPYLGTWEGEPVMLLELPHSHIPPGSDKLVDWLRQRGIRPLLAHPERNPDIARDPSRLGAFVDQGCLVQVTAGSLVNDFGEIFRDAAMAMLEAGWVTVLASDAHRADRRTPVIEPGRQVAARMVGEDASWRMVRDIPAAILGVAVE
ncbi:MAG: capsular biosynthesis protein [Deltaproteobacteria bacterium]|jgi:protein-tyrosine phosphatase|nr:capsular biosynthesis protein [Deltaproteobacteria bacterium]